MKQDWRSAIALPVSVRAGLERYCHQLRDALGEQLVAVILYGGLAKGEYTPQHSNVNVMVVLQDVTTEVLDNMVAPVQQGMRDLRLAVMVLSANNLHRSAPVFPSKFLDMQQHHHVLWGKAVLTALPISQEHLRLRCEQEIKNLLLRLRQSSLQRVTAPNSWRAHS